MSPAAAVRRCLVREGDAVVLCRGGGERLIHRGPVRLVAVGKAARAMAEAAADVAGAALEGGVVVVPGPAPAIDDAPLRLLVGSHPVPGQGSLAAGRLVLAEARGVRSDTLLLVLVSGGASSLVAVPGAGVDLADKQRMTEALLAAGTPIHALNTVRRHCSAVKGGGLLRAAAGARAVWTLALSDVVGDDPATIGSGPTAPDPTTHADAAAVLARFAPDAPPPIRAAIAEGVAGRRAETLKPGDPLLDHAAFEVIGSNALAVEALATAAAGAGYHVEHLAAPIAGDARTAGEGIGRRLRARARGGDRVALVGGGEPTVRVVAGGRGGRAQHLALAAVPALAGTPCVLLAAGTDGVDGPTDAAGACVDGDTMASAVALGLDVHAALEATDAHSVLDRLGALVRTGPTGTNVADVVIGLCAC